LALDFVEFGRLVEKLSLEIFFVDFAVADAENHEHLKGHSKRFFWVKHDFWSKVFLPTRMSVLGIVDLLFDWFGISCRTTDNFCFYLQNRLTQTGGQQYSGTSPL
jgi:hypothetical protein